MSVQFFGVHCFDVRQHCSILKMCGRMEISHASDAP